MTGAVCVACAALSPGTLANRIAGPTPAPLTMITIEHPAGTIDVAVTMDLSGPEPGIKAAGILRTARLLFSGTVMVPERALAGATVAA